MFVLLLSGISGKPVEVDNCLNIEHVKQNYKTCCTNHGFKVEGRKDICSEAGKIVKRKM